ncbi:MAG: hypothetical protein IH820_08645 [Bacteroidetes bacterium]|nr:hypothetical protein [Bacteroidota bacterium]
MTVAATTRRPEREAMLRENGADHVFIDTGEIANMEIVPAFSSFIYRLALSTNLQRISLFVQPTPRFGLNVVSGGNETDAEPKSGKGCPLMG